MSLSQNTQQKHVNTLIIWWGQSGLVAAQQCQEKNINYEVVNASSSAWASWRNRYDSLVLFTPPWLSSLPWLPMNLPFHMRPTKDQMADYLETYEKKLWLNIVHNTKALSLQQFWNKLFYLQAQRWKQEIIHYTAHKIIVAVWPYTTPFVPEMAEHIDDEVQQIHVSQYKNPSQIPHEDVLIVWWWNSWYFSARDFVKAGRDITIAEKPIKNYADFLLWWKVLQAKFWLIHALNWDYPCWNAKASIQVPRKDYLLWTKYSWMNKKPGVVAMSWDLVKFADNDSMRVKSIIRATWYKKSYPWINIENLLDTRWSIIQNNWISAVPWIYDMTCIERIDSSVRVGKQIVEHIVSNSH